MGKFNVEEIVARLTEEQTAELAEECLRNLPGDIAATVVVEALSVGEQHEVLDALRKSLGEE